MNHQELITKATEALNRYQKDKFKSGQVACALQTKQGNIFTGVCIDTTSGMGYCAEHNAIGTMITAKEYQIDTIVAVKHDKETGKTHILKPCGRCREFIRQVDASNMDTQIIVSADETMTLTELLPY